MRRASKIDDAQTEVVRWLRAIGATVQSLASVGQGCPDLLVAYRGVNVLMEVKSGRLPPSRRKLTPAQVKWHASWRGQVAIVECAEDAVALLRRLAPPLGAKAVIYVPGDVEVDASDWERP
jgi:hypothetical protein